MSDCVAGEFNDVRFDAVNDVAGLRRKGAPCKRPEEFVEYGKKLNSKVDVLLCMTYPTLTYMSIG